MHATLEDLLSYRDGEALGATARHIDSCPSCQAELASVNAVTRSLREMPLESPRVDGWRAVRRELDSGSVWGRPWVAAAAAAMIFAASLFLIHAPGPDPKGSDMLAASGKLNGDAKALEELITKSQQLESTFRRIDPGHRVQSAWQATATARLEDEISVVDHRLASSEELNLSRGEEVNLWKKRVKLLDALVGVQKAKSKSVSI